MSNYKPSDFVTSKIGIGVYSDQTLSAPYTFKVEYPADLFSLARSEFGYSGYDVIDESFGTLNVTVYDEMVSYVKIPISSNINVSDLQDHRDTYSLNVSYGDMLGSNGLFADINAVQGSIELN